MKIKRKFLPLFYKGEVAKTPLTFREIKSGDSPWRVRRGMDGISLIRNTPLIPHLASPLYNVGRNFPGKGFESLWNTLFICLLLQAFFPYSTTGEDIKAHTNDPNFHPQALDDCLKLGIQNYGPLKL